jgi:hypothetical protein
MLELNNYKILRFSNNEVIDNLYGTLNKIKEYIIYNLVPLHGGPQGVNKNP